MEIRGIANQFAIRGSILRVVPYGSGYIHDTYRAINSFENGQDYLLQRINTDVFTNVSSLMENIALVTGELQRTLDRSGISTKTFRSLQLVSGTNGAPFIELDGTYWRLYQFMDELHSYDTLPNELLIYECGQGYGRFLAYLSVLAPENLAETIPDFHNMGKRLEALERAWLAKSDPAAEESYRYIQEVADSLLAEAARPVPLRVTHNDTKCNNILFDDQDHATCVVDLDTVMPGKVWYDTGDSLRTLMTKAAEDEPDLTRVKLEPERFRLFIEGYLEMTHHLLTEEELASIPLSPALMAYIMAIRFLTDHLQGDTYYKTDFRGHNLQRSRSQLTLVKEVLKHQDQLRSLQEEVVQRLHRK